MTDTLADVARTDAPRDNLLRTAEFRAQPSEDGLTLEGYAAVFNTETVIDSWEGTFREQIAPGAFKRSIGMKTPILQYDHGQHPLIGSLPIGVIRSLREDDHGLRVKARLTDNWLVEPVRDAIREGAISGMSFRFRVVSDEWTEKRGEMPLRTITELDCLELGPVCWPAYEATSVGVRSRQVADALTDPEVRAELARLLATGTDLRSLADVPAPDDVHAETVDAPAERHAPTRTHAQRRALALLTL